jgi:hypothetical protein
VVKTLEEAPMKYPFCLPGSAGDGHTVLRMLLPCWQRMRSVVEACGLLVVCSLWATAGEIHIGPGQQYPTLQAAAPYIKAGDTVYLHGGEYRGYSFAQGLRGDSTAWIVFMPYRDEQPIIRGNWQLSSIAYVRFERLRFQGDATSNSGPFLNIDNGGSCATQSHHVVISECSFGDNQQGNTLKFGGVDDFEVAGCTFRNQGDGNAGLALNVCHRGWVHDNVFENVQGRAVQFKLGTTSVRFERNLVVGCGAIDAALRIGEAGGVNFHCPGDNWTARDIKVYSNIIIGGRAAFAIGQAQQCRIVHNTFVNPQQFVFRILGEQPQFRCDSNSITNNIFYLTATRYFNGSSGSGTNIDYRSHVVDHNLFFFAPDPTWQPDPYGGPYDMEELAGVQLTGNIGGDPLFVDLGGNDVRLRSGSPAIGAGRIVGEPSTDFFRRPFRTPPTVGAVEVEDTTGVDPFDVPGVHPAPHPVTGSSVTLRVDASPVEWVRVWDVVGREYPCRWEVTGDGSIELRVESLSTGLYIVVCKVGKRVLSRSVVVK